ncbi:MAG: hypothetical protein K2L21_07380 [Muribaculaceae bacterium]|nr:hypothetical protein [Muribaculaceae bacterium]
MKNIKVWEQAPDSARLLADTLAAEGIPSAATVIYDQRNRLASYKAHDGLTYNIKAFRIPHIINRIAYGWLRGSKARRAYDNAVRLCELNVATPLPYAYIEEFDAMHWLRRSYFVSSQLPDDFKQIRDAGLSDDFENIVREVADFVADFHKKGVWMVDLTPGNILWRSSYDGYEFSLVDVNRMKFDVRKIDTLVKSCGRLFESAEARSLFATYYSEAMSLPREYVVKLMEKQVAADIARRSRKKALLHPEKFFNRGKQRL